ncbi:hypothetical protein ACLMJK_007917 [Lecanora helva]
MAALIQTIAVVDKSGKAVSTSKHLVNVFKEAKAAYLERKAEVIAHRSYGNEEKRHLKALKGATYNDKSHASSRTHSRHNHDGNTSRTHHRHSRSSGRGESRSIYPTSEGRHSTDLRSPCSPTYKPEPLARRHSAHEDDFQANPPQQLIRAMTSPIPSDSHIDMDLAYGPIPPPLPVARRGAEEQEFKGHVQKVKRILEEADCLQHSVSAIIATLQKNPDAMAAVALTLAEISNVVTKMAPSIITSMKASSPAVFELLASPQFLIAGGVAVGVTIVAFGGFKIVRKIQAKQAMGVPAMDEMMEIGGDVNRIDKWRRGIADEQERSIGTSVEGEFITPQAAALSRMNLNELGFSEGRQKGSVDQKTDSIKSKSERPSRTSTKEPLKTSSKKSKKEKVKKPSPLRALFT